MKAFACLLVAVVNAGADSATFTYEGDMFPEEIGWGRITFLTCDRSLERGWFVQACDLGTSSGPIGEMDFYERTVSDFAGQATFFVEWRVQTDAPSVLFEHDAIATVFSVCGRFSPCYHFTLTDTRVRLLRSNFLPMVFVGIDAQSPHTYRLELTGADRYEWYVDGHPVASGAPEGPYPTSNSRIVWGTRHNVYENTARWDYIRFGLIPEHGSGDYDSDAEVGLDDFYFFHECLTNQRPGINGGPGNDAGPGCRFADFDGDMDVDLLDFAEFQLAFTTGN